MTHLFRELRRREERKQPIRVGVIGAGFMGRGIVYQLSKMPGMRPGLLVNRTPQRAIDAFVQAGHAAANVLVSDNVDKLAAAIAEGRPAVSSTFEIAAAIPTLDVVVEATGVVELGAREALAAIRHKKHFVSLNAETDGTVGCILAHKARQSGVVYSNSDGDQPGVIMRVIEYCQACGFEPRVAVNCKGFMDIRATPQSIMQWAIKQNTSPRMTAAFTDGTKMNIEQTVVCNASGFIPMKRGMFGVKTELKSAIADFRSAGAIPASGPASVDYTLGGDFGGGIFVLARAEHEQMVRPYLRYLKMGDGPDYLFFRPYHLCHIETPISAAEAVIYQEPTIAPRGKPVSHTIAVAKRDLKAGEALDGMGGFTFYGQADAAGRVAGLLPAGLADGVKLRRDIRQDEPIPLDAVELDESSLLVRLWREQERMA